MVISSDQEQGEVLRIGPPATVFPGNMALGATRKNIFWLLSRQGLLVAAGGAVIGLGSAYAAGRLVASWLFQVRPTDPFILTVTLMLVLGVTIVATLIPAVRAARIDPALSLRFE